MPAWKYCFGALVSETTNKLDSENKDIYFIYNYNKNNIQ